MVVARVLASFATAVLVGWWCLAQGGRLRLERRGAVHQHADGFVATARHDLLYAGGFLVLGAMIAAAVNTSCHGASDAVAGQALRYLTGLEIACCAAEAVVVRVRVSRPQAAAPDQWVEVTGTWLERTGADAGLPVTLRADRAVEVEAPPEVYG